MNFQSLYDLNNTFGPTAWVISGILIFFVLEYVVPFRPLTLSKIRRWRINFSLTLCNVVIVDLCFLTLLRQTTLFSGQLQLDLFNAWQLSSFLRIVICILVLDCITYFWHRLNHQIPLLWRFHRVHHTDLNVDVSSASRFHFGEVTGTTVITYSFMLILGATILEVRIFQVFLFLMAQFGHSNIKLWKPIEDALMWVVVPPSMHRIHHSDLREEMDSNYGTIFSFWDRIFGSFRRKDTQNEIIFGLKEFPDPKRLNLRNLLIMPFEKLFSKVARKQ